MRWQPPEPSSRRRLRTAQIQVYQRWQLADADKTAIGHIGVRKHKYFKCRQVDKVNGSPTIDGGLAQIERAQPSEGLQSKHAKIRNSGTSEAKLRQIGKSSDGTQI